jgi:hypothetical protein
VNAPTGRWDAVALRAGALVALVFAVPLSLGASWAASAGNTALAVWLSIGAVAGFGVGAGCAAWVQRVGLPISHGLATAAGTYIAAQTVFIAFELVTGDEVNWFGAMFNLSVVMGVGLLGGLLGRRLRNQGVLPSIERGRR